MELLLVFVFILCLVGLVYVFEKSSRPKIFKKTTVEVGDLFGSSIGDYIRQVVSVKPLKYILVHPEISTSGHTLDSFRKEDLLNDFYYLGNIND